MLTYDEPLITADKVLNEFTPQKSAGLTHSALMQILKINNGTEKLDIC